MHEIIPIIRKSSPDSIIFVGTANYSQFVDEAADDPLSLIISCMFVISMQEPGDSLK